LIYGAKVLKLSLILSPISNLNKNEENFDLIIAGTRYGFCLASPSTRKEDVHPR
jgi:hypothetical protein